MLNKKTHKCADCGATLTSCAWCTPEAHLCDECRSLFEDDSNACDDAAVAAVEQRRAEQIRKSLTSH